jgi:long-chain fatty acid transport protein
MRKTLFILFFSFLAIALMAGGIVTNTNQSASFTRNPARDASLGIDATYFNPAGLTQLRDGFHISLSNQFISQKRTVSTTFPGLNRNTFEGSVSAPLFPSAYVAYKKNKLAVSFGFNPIGGGGSAAYEDGLPSFEMMVAAIPGSLSGGGIPTTAYSYETSFEGNSVFYGIQGNLSYQLSEVVSISLGARYVMINNSYQGYVRNIQINPVYPTLGYSGTMVKAPTFFTDFSGFLGLVSGQLNATGNSLQPIIDGGGGGVPLANGTMAGLSPEQVATLQATIQGFGGDPSGMTIAQAQGFFAGASQQFAANSEAMAQNAAASGDMEVDATQSGSGIVPIVGINLTFDWFNIGIKYEHKASMKVKNDTKIDDVGLYPNGVEVPSDMPAMLSIGANFDFSERVSLSTGYHTYFDKGAEYGKTLNGQYVKNDQLMDKNLWEFAIGMDYRPLEKWEFSIGYLFTETGVKPAYQSDLSHSLSTWSLGGGILFKATENIGVNLGAMRTFYRPDIKSFGAFAETYARKATVFAVGLDISF